MASGRGDDAGVAVPGADTEGDGCFGIGSGKTRKTTNDGYTKMETETPPDDKKIEERTSALRAYLTDPESPYKMNHKKRGNMIIISNHTFHAQTKMEKRDGTHQDAEYLSRTFTQLGFTCKTLTNCTADGMLQTVTEAARSKEYDCDCMAFAFLSHGDKDEIYGTDKMISIERLLSPLKKVENMKKFAGKPKLIFIQACRGVKLDPAIVIQDDDAKAPVAKPLKIPIEADFLYSHSTSPGYFSFRSPEKGSVYVTVLCDMLLKYHSTLDLVHILTRVNHQVAYEFESLAARENPYFHLISYKKQMPSIVSMLTKDLYFGTSQ